MCQALPRPRHKSNCDPTVKLDQCLVWGLLHRFAQARSPPTLAIPVRAVSALLRPWLVLLGKTTSSALHQCYTDVNDRPTPT
jgi:hypothetical protein